MREPSTNEGFVMGILEGKIAILTGAGGEIVLKLVKK
jgi:hypothetical protein